MCDENKVNKLKEAFELDTRKDALKIAIKKHDWYYHYSDSMKVYDAGERSAKAINKMIIELGDEGKRIFNELAPEEFKTK